ncbi:MAG: PD-(D/E)XK motif protein [Thermoguttaceae bacterium]|nr:PD-(D/E)XK motif protein [Thermoguttaceae bacterium]
MTTEIDRLKFIWESLGSLHEESGWKLITVSEQPAGRILAGRYYPDNLESLVVVFPDFVPGKQWNFPEGRGFSVRIVPPQSEFEGYGIALCRKREGGLELFTLMSEDLLRLLLQQTQHPTKNCTEVFLQRIYAWQKFMQSESSRHLSTEQVRGLWGELEFIRRLVENGVPLRTAIQTWRGPLNNLHDFQFASAHVEIKTSCNENGFAVFIGSLEQLTPVNGVPLYLSAFRLETAENGLNLAEQIEEIDQLIGDDSQTQILFDSLLLNVGYLAKDAERYADKFRVQKAVLYPVDDQFPCLTRHNVPVTIASARYTLQLEQMAMNTIPFNHFCEEVIHE